ncbi:MAG: insulinase family protein [Sedimentisphaerales bacterium]|nr:insulinase family protein [Sedimentisphaerales bacterium]
MEFKRTQLENGLTIIAETSDTARSMALGFFTRTGGRDETPEISGLSHFLEHMLFKGTDNRSPFEVNLEFDAMGAKYNAFTSEENTVYYAAVLPEYQRRVLDLWADLMRPALREEDFNTEKGVICEEIAMYQDMPNFDVLDRCRKLHYGDHPCGNSVLGTVESIKALTCEQMREYFNRRYAPDNIVLACSGKVDWDMLVQQAGELCGEWKPSSPARAITDFTGTGAKETVVQEKVVREHICLMSSAPSMQDPLRYAASVLSNVVGDSTNSRLYWALVDNALTDCAEMACDSMDGSGVFYTYISCDPQQTGKVLDITKRVLTDVVKGGLTDQELTASKNKIASSATLSGELPMGRLVPLGFGWVYRKDYIPLADEIAAIQAVTHDDIRQLLQAHPLDKPTIMGLGPCPKI